MAISTNERQITWGPNDENSGSVSGSGTNTSDISAISSNAFQAQAELKADHGGTPGSGDTVDLWLLQALGDPDGTGSDEFETDEQGTFLATLDMNADDPAISVVELPLPINQTKVKAKNNAGEAITVSATILEQTG